MEGDLLIVWAAAAAAIVVLAVMAGHHGAGLLRLREGLRRLARGDSNLPLMPDLPRSLKEAGNDLKILAARMKDLGEAARENSDFAMILGTIGEGVFIVDRGMRLRFSNQGTQRLFGLEQAPAGLTVMEAFRSLDLQQVVQEGIATGTPRRGEVVIDGGNPAKVFELNVSPLAIGDGQTGAVVVVHDITRIKGLERVRREFVANVSHELRTPLTIIGGYLETLLEGGMEDRETTENALQVMFRHADRLQHLVEDLLTISRAESRSVPLDVQTFDLCALLRRVIEQFDSPIRAQGAEVRIVRDGDSFPCEGDPARLEQVFLNLLENALKYGAHSGLVVTFELGRSEAGVRVRVSDNGPGIPYEDQEHIFERFYRVHKHRSRESGGTGLGLSIVKNVVAAHGGTVSVQSTPGEGSTFLVTLPLGSGGSAAGPA